MVDVAARLFDIGLMDALAHQETSVHRVDPRAKLITTTLFVGVVLSFGKYHVTPLTPFLLYPVFLIAAGRIPLAYLLKKTAYVAPFAVVVGIFNPLLDTAPMVAAGPIAISGGWISFGAILLRFFLTVITTLALLAVTGLYPLLFAAEQLGAPRVLTLQLMFFYRYLFVLANETLRSLRARSLRMVGDHTGGLTGFGSMVGQLLLRTLDRAERISRAMYARGFDGAVHLAKPQRFGVQDALFVLAWGGLFVLCRVINLPEAIGDAALGAFQ